jgi:hypothetical protein
VCGLSFLPLSSCLALTLPTAVAGRALPPFLCNMELGGQISSEDSNSTYGLIVGELLCTYAGGKKGGGGAKDKAQKLRGICSGGD